MFTIDSDRSLCYISAEMSGGVLNTAKECDCRVFSSQVQGCAGSITRKLTPPASGCMNTSCGYIERCGGGKEEEVEN